MTAPAVVLLAHATHDRRAAATVTGLVREVRAQRADLRVAGALVETVRPAVRPTLPGVVDRLVREGRDEVVVVPLQLGQPCPETSATARAIARASARHRDVRVRAAEAVGLWPAFLGVLDERLRESLRASRVRELDALVLAGPGSPDPLFNASVARLARIWGARHRLPVSAAYAASAPPSAGEAVRAFRGAGRRHIAVGSLFLTPGLLSARAAELALEAGAVAVSEPLGVHSEVARAVLARYAVGAVELVPV